MSDDKTEALDATIRRNAEVVRRGRSGRGFLKKLGLSLPVTVDDVKQAYFARAREAHPDVRGSTTDFKEVQEAFDKAVEFAQRNEKRLPWIGAQLPVYVAQREVSELIESWGGRVAMQQLDWLEDTIGEDFAQIAERLVQIDLSGADIGDAEIRQLVKNAAGLGFLESLLLAETKITDEGVILLISNTRLRRLDLRGTEVTFNMRRQLARLSGMERVDGASRFDQWFRGK